MTDWLKRLFRPAAHRDTDSRADAPTTRFVRRCARVEIGSDGHLRVEDKPADDDDA